MGVAVADVQYDAPKAITVLATAVPQALFEQSLTPEPKLTLRHRQVGSGVPHPRVAYSANKLLEHV